MDIKSVLVDMVFGDVGNKPIPMPERKRIDPTVLNNVRARLATEPQEAFTKVYVNGNLAYRIYRITEIGRYITVDPVKPDVREDDRGRGFGDVEGAIIDEGHGRARIHSRDEQEIKLLDGNLLRNPYLKLVYKYLER